METESSWLADSLSTWGDQMRVGAERFPDILGALAVLVLGWLIARVVRRGVRAAANAANRFLGRTLRDGAVAEIRVSPLMITVLGEIFFWIVVAIAATLALRIAGFGVIAQWLDRVAVHLPNLAAAFVILVVGFLLSMFVRERLIPLGVRPGEVSQWARSAPLAQALIIVIASIVALDQIGIDVGLLVALAVVCVAAITFTLGATFALGARRYTANLVGIKSARMQLSVGEWLRIDDVEGQVLEISATQIVLDTEQGRVLLPGHYMDEKVATILYRSTGQETRHG